MLNYVLNGGIVTLPGFFPADKYWDIKKDLDKNLQWRETHQPFKGPYGNRLQAFPCYESPYDKENDFTINKLEDILQTKICDFKTLARKIVLSEVKQSPQNFGKYGFIHRDTSIEDKKPLIAAVNSIRLLVVSFSPPNNSFFLFSKMTIAAQPPGPGLPIQAPSV